VRFPSVADTANRDVYATAVRPRYGFFAKHNNEIVREYLRGVTCVSSTDEEWLLTAQGCRCCAFRRRSLHHALRTSINGGEGSERAYLTTRSTGRPHARSASLETGSQSGAISEGQPIIHAPAPVAADVRAYSDAHCPAEGATRASMRSAGIRCDKRRQQRCASMQAKERVSAPQRSQLIGSTLAAHAEPDLPLPAPGEGAILGPTTTPNPGDVG
jgi:hypothetical protein